MITSSTAFAVALPSHFQFTTSAKTDEGKRIQVDCVCWMRNVVGATVGMNEKGGMDMVEFAEYIRNASCHSFRMPSRRWEVGGFEMLFRTRPDEY
jgi:hypothetical protein